MSTEGLPDRRGVERRGASSKNRPNRRSMNTQAHRLSRAEPSRGSRAAMDGRPRTAQDDNPESADGGRRRRAGDRIWISKWFVRLVECLALPTPRCRRTPRLLTASVGLLAASVLSGGAADPITKTYTWPDPFIPDLTWFDTLPPGGVYSGTTRTTDNRFPLFADWFEASGMFLTLGVPNAFGAYSLPIEVPTGQWLTEFQCNLDVANVPGQTGVPGTGFGVCLVPTESNDPLGSHGGDHLFRPHFVNDIAGAGTYAGICVGLLPNSCNAIDTTFAHLEDTNPPPFDGCNSAIVLTVAGEIVARHETPCVEGGCNNPDSQVTAAFPADHYANGGSPFQT